MLVLVLVQVGRGDGYVQQVARHEPAARQSLAVVVARTERVHPTDLTE